MEMDKETAKILDEQGQLKELVSHHGWRIAKERLYKDLIDLDSINATDLEGDEKIILESLRLRKAVIRFIIEWIKKIEGEASATINITEIRKDEYIINIP